MEGLLLTGPTPFSSIGGPFLTPCNLTFGRYMVGSIVNVKSHTPGTLYVTFVTFDFSRIFSSSMCSRFICMCRSFCELPSYLQVLHENFFFGEVPCLVFLWICNCPMYLNAFRQISQLYIGSNAFLGLAGVISTSDLLNITVAASTGFSPLK